MCSFLVSCESNMNTARLQGECVILISQNIKNPGTMKIDYSRKPLIKNDGIEWESTVWAENPFGGMSSQNFHCVNNGEKVRVEFD